MIFKKKLLLIKIRTFEMFGHGFIIADSQAVADVDDSSQKPFLSFFLPFFSKVFTWTCKKY